MSNNINTLVNLIHETNKESGNRFVFTITGGGFSAYTYLMTCPGASNTILELNAPYSREATLKYIENKVDSFASLEAANELSIYSLKSCCDLMIKSKNDVDYLKNCYGVGVTAALATNRWLKGDHRFHIVITSNNSKFTFSVNLYKGIEPTLFRSRLEEDELCGKLIIYVIAYTCKIITFDMFLKYLYEDNLLNEKDKYEFSQE